MGMEKVMQTIPDAVLAQIVQHRPHLTTLIANLRAYPDQAAQFEQALATAYLLGNTHLSAPDTWYLSQCASGGPWGGDWLTTAHAAHLLGVTDGRIRQRIAAGDLEAIKRGKTWYVRKDAIIAPAGVTP